MVAAFAEVFAKGLEDSAGRGPADPEQLNVVAAGLRDYAAQIRNMLTVPAGAGTG
jgi:hypothetical protein